MRHASKSYNGNYYLPEHVLDWDLGFRVQVVGFGVLGFRVLGVWGFRFQGLGFQGFGVLGCRV